MNSKKDERIEIAAKILMTLNSSSCAKMSVPTAMHYAGFSEDECKNRAKQMTVRRAKEKKEESQFNMVIQVVETTDVIPVLSPLSEASSWLSKSATTATSNSVLTGSFTKLLPGMKVIRQTAHQVHAFAQNKLVLRNMHNAAMKEATIAWNEACKLRKNGEPHKSMKDVLDSINNKAGYKGHVQVYERTVRRCVSEGLIGVTPPRRGCPGSIPPVAYKALLDAVISFVNIKQASGNHEITRSELSKRVNDVINSHPDENRNSGKLLSRLQKDFGAEMNLGKTEKMEERRVRWTTHQNLKMWGDSAKNILIELGFGRQSTPEDNVPGEIFFYEGQMERIINFDETRLSLDQTDAQRGGRPSFVFYNPNHPRPGSATNKSSLSLTLIVGGTAAGEMIPPHFQLCTASQNDESQLWNTGIMSTIHHVYGKFGYFEAKYHPCTFGMNEKGGMNKEEFEQYVINSLITLFPDAADVPLKRVLFKSDSGPGRRNTELMAFLRVRGFYLIPGLPNSTHATQEMELLIEMLKTAFHENLENLTRGCLVRGRTVPTGAEIIGLMLFGGLFFHDHAIDNKPFINAVQVAGEKAKVRGYFEKIGFVPFTRNYLSNKHVRHELTTTAAVADAAIDPMAEVYDNLEIRNAFACSFLNIYDYNGELLLTKLERRSREAVEQQLTRPNTAERVEALAGAATHGQQFKVTGGHHLTSNDFFMADALGKLREQQKTMTAERKARQKQQQQFDNAAPFQDKPENALLVKELDALLRYKLGELPGNLKTKAEKLNRWQQVKDQPSVAFEPWSEEDEAKHTELMEKEITLEDTALGRQKEIFRKQQLAAIATFTAKECQEMMQALEIRADAAM